MVSTAFDPISPEARSATKAATCWGVMPSSGTVVLCSLAILAAVFSSNFAVAWAASDEAFSMASS